MNKQFFFSIIFFLISGTCFAVKKTDIDFILNDANRNPVQNSTSPVTNYLSVNTNNYKKNNKEKIKCPHCPYAVSSEFRLLEHSYKHKPNKSFRCLICELSYVYKKGVIEHIKEKHSKRDRDMWEELD